MYTDTQNYNLEDAALEELRNKIAEDNKQGTSSFQHTKNLLDLEEALLYAIREQEIRLKRLKAEFKKVKAESEDACRAL